MTQVFVFILLITHPPKINENVKSHYFKIHVQLRQLFTIFYALYCETDISISLSLSCCCMFIYSEKNLRFKYQILSLLVIYFLNVHLHKDHGKIEHSETNQNPRGKHIPPKYITAKLILKLYINKTVYSTV